MGRFIQLAVLYVAASAFYFFTSDGFWQALREIVPGFLVALLYFLMGPIVLLDFMQPVSEWPYVFASLLALMLFLGYGRSGKSTYLLLLAGLWIASLVAHWMIMGGISGSPPALY